METETLDKLYLEWSQFTSAKTAKELSLERKLAAAEAKCVGLEKDAARLDCLEETIKACPHSVLTWNDDDDVEDDNGQVPLGFSIRIDGCDPLEISSPTLRELLAALAAQKG